MSPQQDVRCTSERKKDRLRQRLVDATEHLIDLLKLNVCAPPSGSDENVIGIANVLADEFSKMWKQAFEANVEFEKHCPNTTAADTTFGFVAAVAAAQPDWNSFSRNDPIPGTPYRYRDVKYFMANVPCYIEGAKRACGLLKNTARAKSLKSRKRGRPPKIGTDKVAKVVAKIIDRGEHEGHNWGNLARRYEADLKTWRAKRPAEALRKRVERELANRADGNSPRQGK